MPYVAAKIRAARPEDTREIVSLSDALFREDAGSRDPAMNPDWALQHGQTYFDALLRDESAACWLAEPDGEAIGYLAGRVSGADDLRRITLATLESMYVRPGFRGMGVGARLVERFLSWSRSRGARRASVTAYAANAGAARFYEREGFSPKSVSFERDVG